VSQTHFAPLPGASAAHRLVKRLDFSGTAAKNRFASGLFCLLFFQNLVWFVTDLPYEDV